ncbi:MAG: DUF3127 domain-containing protein [Bacteroidetes bacterium]|nr:DUF3127 domain-containing protein [Bacteroidota bacterium]
MNFDIEGKLIEKYDTQQVSDRFRKREFVIEIVEEAYGKEFINCIKFQLNQDKCSELDAFKINDTIKVTFNIKGRKWEKNGSVSYFTNLEAWKITGVNQAASNNVPPPPISEVDLIPLDEDNDDLPF